MFTPIKLSELDTQERLEIADAINNLFDGKVPMDENEFKSVVSPDVAKEIAGDVDRFYESTGYDLKYDAHDLFVLYEDVMR